MPPKKRPARAATRRPKARPVARKKRDWYRAGYDSGFETGTRLGHESFGSLFDGTSIIIPTYNQLAYLKSCIASIVDHTDLPYEIIIVDNGSTDGTAAFLQSLSGQIRYRILDSNRGFAGATNTGLMMAKGQTLLLLNNDTIVTDRWLDNLLTCLNSDPRIGMVGPVTNYISGSQQIEVPYVNVEEMPEFAREFNRSDSAKWHLTDRLTGFCLLFRRELLERTGYLDEGYAIGNFEDDDYNVRVRLQGRLLVIARDTFIHHYGSVSIKALGSELEAVNRNNSTFFSEKWGNPHELIEQVNTLLRRDAQARAAAAPPGEPESADPSSPPLPSESAFFPQGVAVRGVREQIYWVENGQRRPVAGALSFPCARLSQVDLLRWPIGEPMDALEAELRWRGQPAGDGIGPMNGSALSPDGQLYMVEQGVKRRLATQAAAEFWGLQYRVHLTPAVEEWALLPEGLPIIAPSRVSANL
ncbi:glycosyltransferase family 2 protein [Paenibacillus xanthanilyticus]|uniref:Glycosyltransferase family 2 protein n=1 Tax=Paenibacillus xanthanilyticus TaxID=1783531 RepID=A0ABV8K0N0_9BACL